MVYAQKSGTPGGTSQSTGQVGSATEKHMFRPYTMVQVVRHSITPRSGNTKAHTRRRAAHIPFVPKPKNLAPRSLSLSLNVHNPPSTYAIGAPTREHFLQAPRQQGRTHTSYDVCSEKPCSQQGSRHRGRPPSRHRKRTKRQRPGGLGALRISRRGRHPPHWNRRRGRGGEHAARPAPPCRASEEHK